MSEQRLFLRKKVPLPIPIELLPGKEMWLHDIGEGGLSVSGSSRLEPGTATFFSFQFPDANSMIEASGVVAWCDGSGRVGIRFTRIKPDSTAVLKRWLKSDEKQSSAGAEPIVAEAPRAGIEGDASALRHEIARANLDSSRAFQLLAERMKDRTRASGAAIALRDVDAVICRASSGNAPPAGTPLNIDNTVTGECYRSGNIVSITDTEKDSRVDAELCRQLEFRSLLIVPIASGEEVVGILEVFSPLAGNFEGGDILLLGSVAEVVAEIHGAEQRKPSALTPDLAQPIPFLVSDRLEQAPHSDETESEKQESRISANTPHDSIQPMTDKGAAGHNETRIESRETAARESSSWADRSESPQNEESESHWKPRNYLLLMAGLTILGIGMGDIADWRMTSRLARSGVQPVAAIKGQDSTTVSDTDPKVPEHDDGLLSTGANLPARSPTLPTSVPPEKTSGAKVEKSSFILTNSAQGAAGAPMPGDLQTSLRPSEAIPLAGPVPNLDPKTASQLTPAKLLHRVDPVVPDFAKSADIEGTVLLSAVIGTDGRLKDVKFVSGDRALAIEAFRAVRDWRYRPYMLNGKPIEAETRIVMNFKP